jgi:hypothetical protein
MKAEHAEPVEVHGQRVEEDDLDVEDDEEHRRQVVVDEKFEGWNDPAETPDSKE